MLAGVQTHCTAHEVTASQGCHDALVLRTLKLKTVMALRVMAGSARVADD